MQLSIYVAYILCLPPTLHVMTSSADIKFSPSFTLPPWHQPISYNHRDKEEVHMPTCPAPDQPPKKDCTCTIS